MYIIIARKCRYEMNNTYVSIYIDTWFTLIFTISGYLLFSSNQSTAVCPTSTAALTAAASAASGSATGTTTAETWATSRSAVSSRPRHFCRCCSWKGKTKKKCFHLRVKLYAPLHLQPRPPATRPTSSAAWPRGRASRWPSSVTTRTTAETTATRSIVVRWIGGKAVLC